MNLTRYSRYPSRRLALEAAMGAVLWRGGKRLLRKRAAPALFELAEVADAVHTEAAPLLTAGPLLNGRLDDEWLRETRQEFELHRSDLERRYQEKELTFPYNWAVEDETSFVLYGLARALRPEVAIEIGVANGHSSFFLLRALRENGGGHLHSFDIADGVGGLVEDSERGAWELVRLDPRCSIRDLERRLEGLPAAGLCFHDADHGYLAQFAEFGLFWDKLAPNGILVADDVDGSFALIDFVAEHPCHPLLLIDTRKVIGVLCRNRAG